MKTAAMALLLLSTASATHADVPQDLIFTPQLRDNASLNGTMFTHETEFLTPEGILDHLPEPDPATIEPAAGPEETTPQDPVVSEEPAVPGL